jgi:hypothetical protein
VLLATTVCAPDMPRVCPYVRVACTCSRSKVPANRLEFAMRLVTRADLVLTVAPEAIRTAS